MNARAYFTLLPLMHWTAVFMLAAAGALALSGFMPMPAAIASAVVLTFLLKTLVEHAADAYAAGKKTAALLFCAGAVLIASITVALTAASLYARVFAVPSAIADWTVRREPLERELQRVLALANTAQGAMTNWASDAAAKAMEEGREKGGGSCPALPQTGGSRGPVAKWREDDSTIAGSLAAELKGLVEVAQSSTDKLLAQPKPTEFTAVKTGFEAGNAASDAVTRMTGAGNYAADTLRALDSRRISTIDRAGQPPTSCGDGARLEYISRASAALTALSQLKAMPRMHPGVDVSDPHDVLSRSLLRSLNGVMAMASAGHLGSFAGDDLMQNALKKNGVMNRETLAFAISIVAEISVILTALLMVRQRRQPYTDNVVSWIDADEQRHPQTGTGRAVLRGAAKRMANLFYAEAPSAPAATEVFDAAPAAATAPISGLIELPEDPRLSREREAAWSGSLLDHHVPWGQRDLLFIPITAETGLARHMARALGYQKQAVLVTDSAPAKLLNEPEVRTHLESAHGPDWCKQRYQVYALDPAYAQLMRLRALGGQLTAATPWVAPSPAARHEPLRHRLARRPGQNRPSWA